MTHTATAEIFVTKLAAVRRQIDASIRMFFVDEDELAIHTIIAAAFCLIKGLTAKTKMTILTLDKDYILIFIVESARVIAKGNCLSLQHKLLIEQAGLQEPIAQVTEWLKEHGVDAEYHEIPLSILHQVPEKAYWNSRNLNSNFLKHADRAREAPISDGDIKNDKWILDSIFGYSRLHHSLSPEMWLFCGWNFSFHTSDPDPERFSLSDIIGDVLRTRRPRFRKKVCIRLLRTWDASVYGSRSQQSLRVFPHIGRSEFVVPTFPSVSD